MCAEMTNNKLKIHFCLVDLLVVVVVAIVLELLFEYVYFFSMYPVHPHAQHALQIILNAWSLERSK